MRSQGREDAKNLTVVAIGALAGLAITAALLTDGTAAPPITYAVIAGNAAPAPSAARFVPGAAMDDRLFGHVVTRSGDRFEGYIRWDRNEGSWADLLDATKESPRSTLSGIRFGHVAAIEPTGSHSALITLKSGDRVRFGGRASDLGSGLRALVVDDVSRGVAHLEWHDLDRVEFQPAPDGMRPVSARLYGTMRTSAGPEYTGYVTWDVDEIYTVDVLDGEDEAGRDREIPFGDIRSIERESSRAARVVLKSGERLVLRGTNDVNSSNSGISVSDPTLGQVKVSWSDFDRVDFSDRPGPDRYDAFDGGTPLFGTVVTEDGESLSGRIVWDRDEAFSWELLNGEFRGIEYHVEFSQIASIVKRFSGSGVEVTLRDGRSLALGGSNDVDRGNRGIVVIGADAERRIRWEDFSELRLDSR